jgi:hypothetical protein
MADVEGALVVVFVEDDPPPPPPPPPQADNSIKEIANNIIEDKK